MGSDAVCLGHVGGSRRKAEVGIAHRGCCDKRGWKGTRGEPEGYVAIVMSRVVVNTRNIVIGILSKSIIEHGEFCSAVKVPE